MTEEEYQNLYKGNLSLEQKTFIDIARQFTRIADYCDFLHDERKKQNACLEKMQKDYELQDKIQNINECKE